MSAGRIDLVADFYDPMSIKGPTHMDRGSGTSNKLTFEASSNLPDDISGFMGNAGEKTSLNLMILKYAVDPLRHRDHNVVISTTEGNILTSNGGIQSL